MGQLQNGKWTDDDVLREIEDGRYTKKPSVFRNWVTADGSSEFPAAAGRYHLIWAMGCPWAHRAALYRVLKKLDGVVTITDTAQREGGQGWWFGAQGFDFGQCRTPILVELANRIHDGGVFAPTLQRVTNSIRFVSEGLDVEHV